MNPATWLEKRLDLQLVDLWGGEWMPSHYLRPLLEIVVHPDDDIDGCCCGWDIDTGFLDRYYQRQQLPADPLGNAMRWRPGDPVYPWMSTVD